MDASKLKHDINNEIIKLKSIFEIIIDDDTSFPKTQLISDADSCLDTLKEYLNKLNFSN